MTRAKFLHFPRSVGDHVPGRTASRRVRGYPGDRVRVPARQGPDRLTYRQTTVLALIAAATLLAAIGRHEAPHELAQPASVAASDKADL